MALQGEQLQVVPDIENAEHDPPLSKKPCEATEVVAKPSSSKINSSEWDIKLHREQTTVATPPVSYRAPRSPLSAHRHPPIRRLSHDAQPMSASEIMNLRNILS